MTRPFVLLAFALMGLILAQTCSAGPATNRAISTRDVDSDADESDQPDSESESEIEDDEAEENPAPTCLLFGDKACHLECSITAQVYGIKAEGHCDENQTCQCHISGDIPFHKAWQKKFDSDYVYRKIKNNEMVLDQAHRIFNFPLRTADQFKQLFKPIISPYQFSKLETHDDSLAAKFTAKGEDKVDDEAVQKYVSEEVAKRLKSSAKSLLTTKYQQKFSQALKESDGSKGTLYNLTFRVRQLKNKSLEDILKEYLKKNNLEEPKVEQDKKECLNVILSTAIANEIIKQNDERSKSPKKPATAAKKKAPARATSPKAKSAKKPQKA